MRSKRAACLFGFDARATVADYVQICDTPAFEKEYAHVEFDDNEKRVNSDSLFSKAHQWNRALPVQKNTLACDGLADDLAIQPLKNLAVLARGGDTVDRPYLPSRKNIAKQPSSFLFARTRSGLPRVVLW